MQKLLFWDSGSVPFFCWKNPGWSIRKNAELTDNVSGFILFDGIGENPFAEHHEWNCRVAVDGCTDPVLYHAKAGVIKNA